MKKNILSNHTSFETEFEKGKRFLLEKKDYQALKHLKRACDLAPDNPDVFHLLGIAYLKNKDFKKAELNIKNAISIVRHPLFLNSLGSLYYEIKEYNEAIKIYEEVLKIEPNNHQIYLSLGILYSLQEQTEDIISLLKDVIPQFQNDFNLIFILKEAYKKKNQLIQAYLLLETFLEKSKDRALVYAELADLYLTIGELQEASRYIDMSLKENPNFSRGVFIKALLLKKQKKFKEALECLEKAHSLDKSRAIILNELYVVSRRILDWDKAFFYISKAYALEPTSYSYKYNYAACLIYRHDYAKGLLFLKELLSADSVTADAITLYAVACSMLGKQEEVIHYFEKAVAFDPQNPLMQANLSLQEMKYGKLEEGLQRYEWRLKLAESSNLIPFLEKGAWAGQNIEGKKLILLPEQGLGDFIQFVRYVPLIREKYNPSSIFIACSKSLQRLIQTSFPQEVCIEIGSMFNNANYALAITSLAFIFKTNLETIPNNIPYLKVSSELIQEWATIIPAYEGLKIGIVWAGNALQSNDYFRSIDLPAFKTLFGIKQSKFYSLQIGERASEIEKNNFKENLIDLSDKITDFADTAAAIMNLDLVISVDTSVVHLAGSLGRPVWVLLPFNSDWRWFTDRVDSPWYPTVRLFRQKKGVGWNSLLEEMKKELDEIVNGQKLKSNLPWLLKS